MFVYQMYETCVGHTEGDLHPVYLIVTDGALYLLTTKYGSTKFHREAVVPFKELDYISVSVRSTVH